MKSSECAKVIVALRSASNPEWKQSMSKFGVNTDNALGLSVPFLRSMAKTIGINHNLAQELWSSGIHEARILATMIDDPSLVTEKQMGRWASDMDSWDICDSCCGNLFDRTRFAYKKAKEWAKADHEFTKRASFAIMAALAVHDKTANDGLFIGFFPCIVNAADDERNFVKKAVNWSLRNIGKRNLALNKAAIRVATQIKSMDSRSARWIASDALRELRSPAVAARLRAR